MNRSIDTKLFLTTVARYGTGAASYLRNQGFVEKSVIAAAYREEYRGRVSKVRNGWSLTQHGWSELRELYGGKS